MHRPILLGALAACFGSSLLLAQTVVIPNGYATQAGNAANIFPFGTASTAYAGLHIQFVYDSSEFTNQSVSTPILISGLKFRASPGTATWSGGTYTMASVSMSTAAVDYLNTTTNYATNHGPDLTVMHNGPVVVMPGTGNGAGVPGPYHIDIQFTTPFLYDPSSGDLAIEFDNPSPSTNWGGGTLTALDHVGASGNPVPLVRRVYGSTLYPNANGVDQYAAIMELDYTPAAGYAGKQNYGQGCYDNYASFYEAFAAGLHDLSGLNVTLLNTGTGYTAIGGIATYMPTTSATPLVLADDSEVTQVLTSGMIPTPTGPTNQLTVCSNGFVSVATGNGTGYVPSAGAVLNNPQTGWYNWHDYNPTAAGSGQVMWEETPTHVYVTWDNVFSYGTTGPGNTFQFQFEKANGHVAIIWVTIDNTGNNHVVGYSPGGNSADPGSMDLSAALAAAFNLPGNDTVALALNGDARPVIGTTVNMNITEIPAGSVLAAVIYGLAKFDPGIDLGPFGMPGCEQDRSQDAVSLIIGPGTSATSPFVIVNDPGLVGVIVLSQSAAYDPLGGHNTIGALASNAVQFTLDVN